MNKDWECIAKDFEKLWDYPNSIRGPTNYRKTPQDTARHRKTPQDTARHCKTATRHCKGPQERRMQGYYRYSGVWWWWWWWWGGGGGGVVTKSSGRTF